MAVIENNYIVFIGIACLFTGGLDMLHALSCGEMGLFKGFGANLSFQLQTAARYVESLSLLIAPLFLNKKFNVNKIVCGYLLFSIILLASIFYRAVFPDCFVDGVGPTLFKKMSEKEKQEKLVSNISDVRDITHRLQAEEKLFKSEEKFRSEGFLPCQDRNQELRPLILFQLDFLRELEESNILISSRIFVRFQGVMEGA